jgi:hypothetical protein
LVPVRLHSGHCLLLLFAYYNVLNDLENKAI